MLGAVACFWGFCLAEAFDLILGVPPEEVERELGRLREELDGTILKVNSRLGIFVGLEFNVTGLINVGKLPRNFDVNEKFEVGKRIRVRYIYFNDDKCQISLDIVN